MGKCDIIWGKQDGAQQNYVIDVGCRESEVRSNPFCIRGLEHDI